MSNETMVFPSDLKVDQNDTLWVFSNKLPVFMYGELKNTEYNFRILNQTVTDAIRNTACDSKIVVKSTTAVPKSGGVNIQMEIFTSLLIVLCAISFR